MSTACGLRKPGSTVLNCGFMVMVPVSDQDEAIECTDHILIAGR